jgi:6-phosphogluconolactonase
VNREPKTVNPNRLRPGIDLRVEPDLETASRTAAGLIARALAEAVTARGTAAIAVSGGGTPRGMHRLLAEPPYDRAVPWERVHVFWADERLLPYHHPESTFGAALTDWLDRLPQEPAGVHPVPVGPEPAEAAALYARELEALARRCGTAAPVFDLVELGMGTDGHTASLFPQHPVLEETAAWAAAVKGGSPDVWRVTLTLPVLNRARRVLFLVAGEDKADPVRRALVETPPVLPAGRVAPEGGTVLWVVDEGAARRIGGKGVY